MLQEVVLCVTGVVEGDGWIIVCVKGGWHLCYRGRCFMLQGVVLCVTGVVEGDGWIIVCVMGVWHLVLHR